MNTWLEPIDKVVNYGSFRLFKYVTAVSSMIRLSKSNVFNDEKLNYDKFL